MAFLILIMFSFIYFCLLFGHAVCQGEQTNLTDHLSNWISKIIKSSKTPVYKSVNGITNSNGSFTDTLVVCFCPNQIRGQRRKNNTSWLFFSDAFAVLVMS